MWEAREWGRIERPVEASGGEIALGRLLHRFYTLAAGFLSATPRILPVPHLFSQMLSRPAITAFALMAVVGSAGGFAALWKPDWLEPGPARTQQRRAVRFDPFMQNDIGPYAFRQYCIMDGTRPRDYAEPVPEVRRSRWWAPSP